MTILAAVDFSSLAPRVARLGARIADKLGDRLLLVHAVQPSVPAGGGLVPVEVDVAPALDAAERSLRELAEAVRRDAREVEARVVLGPPEQALTGLASEVGARLIVTGTHGRGAMERLLVGSVAHALVQRASCATLTIRSGGPEGIERWLDGERPLRVLVGIDRGGGGDAGAALAWVRRLETIGPCEVTLLHEYWPPAEYTRLGMRGARDLFETDAEVVAILEQDLAAALGPVAKAPRVRVRVCAAWGPVGETLARQAQADGADLIVVGSTQPRGWRRIKRGSAALSALHAAPVPLLCVPATAADVPEQVPPHARPIPVLRSVLAATDLSEQGDAAVMRAFALLRGQGGTVHLCHVHEHALPAPAYAFPVDPDRALTAERRAEIEARLRSLIPDEAAALNIGARVVVVDGGVPATEIAAAAARLGVDTIVVGSRGRSAVAHALLGSVAAEVVRRAEVPVYVVRG